MQIKKPLAVVVLAAGKGTRMRSPRAKVLHELAGRPMLLHVLDAVEALRPERLLIVVGFQAEDVKSSCRSRENCEFVLQERQLGTGHAVLQTASSLRDFSGDVLVLCGDMPLLKQATLEQLLDEHRRERAAATVLTLKTPEFKDFGRIVRDEQGRIARIVELKDASDREKTVDEYNSGVYCFDKDLLFKVLADLRNDNAQQEYYLTDTIAYLVGRGVSSISTRDAEEIFGINTESDLRQAEKLLKARASSGL